MHESRHLVPLSRIALLVAAGDLLTKGAAKAFLANDPTRFAPWLHFAVVHNDSGAFGWSIGIYTWQLNLALTLAAIVFMIPVTRDLSRVDPAAPRALGLIVGGALGNLASLVTSPNGVVDFIAISVAGGGLVLNVADVAAYAGLAMILRTGVLIAIAMRRETRVEAREAARRTVQLTANPRTLVTREALQARRHLARRGQEREVAVADWNEVGRRPAVAADAPAAPDHEVTPVLRDRDAHRRIRPMGIARHPHGDGDTMAPADIPR